MLKCSVWFLWSVLRCDWLDLLPGADGGSAGGGFPKSGQSVDQRVLPGKHQGVQRRHRPAEPHRLSAEDGKTSVPFSTGEKTLRTISLKRNFQPLVLWALTFGTILTQNACCGAQTPQDWNQNVYFSCDENNRSREKCGVPFSCCIQDPAVSWSIISSDRCRQSSR